MSDTLQYFAMLDRVSKAIAALPRRAATLAVNFSKQRFRDQNWVDNTTQPWAKRKQGWVKESRKRQGRAVLVDTGRLRRSIRTVHVDNDSATIGTDVPYARVHNDGFRGRITQNVRTHTRTVRKKAVRVKAHERTRRVNIPRRRFIGASPILERQINRMMTVEIIKAIKGE